MTIPETTLLGLPEEMLSLILETYFASLDIALWHWAPQNDDFSRDDHYHPRKIPTSFSVLLSCKTLHRLATDVMFEAMTIKHQKTTWVDLQESHFAVPFHRFKHIELDNYMPHFNIPPVPYPDIWPWNWANLKTMRIVNRFEGAHQANLQRLMLLIQCKQVYQVLLEKCNSYNIEFEVGVHILPLNFDGSNPESEMRFMIDKNCHITLTQAYRLAEVDFDKYTRTLNEMSNCIIYKPSWPVSDTSLLLNLSSSPTKLEWIDSIGVAALP